MIDLAQVFDERPRQGPGNGRPRSPVDSRCSLRPIGENEKRETKRGPALSVTPVADLLAEPVRETPWLLDGILTQGGLSGVIAKPKVGKSTFGRCLALAVARGESVLHRTVTGGHVLYVGMEDRRAEIAEHFRIMGATDEPLYVHTGPAPAGRGEAVAQLGDLIREHKAVLAILDTMLRFVRVRDASDYAEMTMALEPLLNLTRETGCHVMVLHHAGKLDRDGVDGVLGSTAIAGMLDTALILKRRGDGVRTLSTVQRYGEDLPESVVSLDPETRQVGIGLALVEQDRRRLENSIIDAVNGGAETESDIREAVGGDGGKVGGAIRNMLRTGRLERTGTGKRGDPYRFLVSRLDVYGATSNGHSGGGELTERDGLEIGFADGP